MSSVAPVHLVGSVGLRDEEDVFRALASSLGTRAKRYPDGETGERHYWIRWQRKVFDANPHLVVVEDAEGYRKDTPLKYCRLLDRSHAASLSFPSLGYADSAIASYKTFERLKNDGVIPLSVRFQVALPTPVAVVTSFIVPEERDLVEPAYEQALVRELDRILKCIPHQQLAIQWDVCHEILAADGAFPLHYEDVIEGTLLRLARLSKPIPEDVELGIHLCYGDPGHKHIKEPASTQTAAEFANGISKKIGRRLDWIHIPVPRERTDDAYFSALAGLELAKETQLMLGLVHFSDGVQGTMQRVNAAKKVAKQFGIATECGFGRRDPATIPELLNVHARIADAID